MIKTGIYCFTNKKNGKRYVGQSINLRDRYKQHRYRYNIIDDSGYNSAIHNAMRKYGWENFSYSIIEECSVDELDAKEIYYIEALNTLTPNGYNILIGGQQTRPSNRRFCPTCGEIKSLDAQQCLSCYEQSRLKNRLYPNKNQKEIDWCLIDEVLSSSFSEVGRKYGYASGNGIKKILKNMNVPYHTEALFDFFFEKHGYHHPTKAKKLQREKEIEAYKQSIAPIAVEQYSLDGEYIASYTSMSQAAKAVGCSSGTISEFFSRKRQTAGGYKWRYANEEEEKNKSES